MSDSQRAAGLLLPLLSGCSSFEEQSCGVAAQREGGGAPDEGEAWRTLRVSRLFRIRGKK
jgi:hypothetical protein